MFQITGKYTTANVMINNVEESCVAQISGFVNHPAFCNPVAIMPDTHAGKGSVIGFTMPLSDKVIPNVIGVDIGCGMLSINIGKSLPIGLDLLDHRIRKFIPFGMNVRSRSDGVIHFKNDFPFKDVMRSSIAFKQSYNNKYGIDFYIPQYDMEWFEEMCNRIGMDLGRAINSVATLGGGNHFIELGQSSNNGDYWLTIHTGSRNLGKRVCDYWQNMATKIVKNEKQEKLNEMIKNIRATYKGMEIKTKIKEARESVGLDVMVNDALQYLEGDDAFGYFSDMIFCQKYAEMNRLYIGKVICKNILGIEFDTNLQMIESIHNFIDFRDFVIRKGAIRSYVGEKMIIPFNMRDDILICEGKSNPEWNFSAPHGAGRVMSRTQAKKAVQLVDFQKSMEGIFSTSVGNGTLDESPFVYKDSKLIEDAIEPTATIIDRIKPIMNLKDSMGNEND